MKIELTQHAKEEYDFFAKNEPKKFERLEKIFNDIIQNGVSKGIGKPEPLTGNLWGFWSRRLDKKNRVVYRIYDDRLQVIQCKGHYSDK